MADGTVYYKVVLYVPVSYCISLLQQLTCPVLQSSPALEGVQEAIRASFSDDLLSGGLEEQSSAATAAASDARTGSPLWKRLLHVVFREEDSSYTVSCRIRMTAALYPLHFQPLLAHSAPRWPRQ